MKKKKKEFLVFFPNYNFVCKFMKILFKRFLSQASGKRLLSSLDIHQPSGPLHKRGLILNLKKKKKEGYFKPLKTQSVVLNTLKEIFWIRMSGGIARGRLAEERKSWRKSHPHVRSPYLPIPFSVL